MSTERQKNKKVITDADKAQMRLLRSDGMGMEKIATRFDVSLSVVHRHVHDVDTPKKKAAPRPASPRAVTRWERSERAKDRDNSYLKPRTRKQVVAQQDDWKRYPFEFSPDATYDTSGPLPDRELVLHAQAILHQWIDSKEKGRIYPTRPTVVTQASLIQLATLDIWNYDTFLEERPMWKIARKLAGVSTTDLAKGLDISAASISRYEKGDRTPATGHLRLLHNAYTDLSEKAHVGAETLLVIDSYLENESRTTDASQADITFDRRDILKFVAREFDAHGFTVEHVPHLATVRSWLPRPGWRVPTVDNLWLVGYPNAASLQPA